MSISKNSLEAPSLNNIFLGKFTLSNSIILAEDLIRWNRGFEIFLIDRYDGEIGNINIAGKYLHFFLIVSPTLYKVSQFTQGAMSIISWFI